MCARLSHRWQCPDCGVYENSPPDNHTCDPRSVIRRQIERLDELWERFPESKQGGFDVFYARWRKGK